MALGIGAPVRGDLEAARRYAEQALTLHQMMEDRREVALALTVIASCEAAGGEAGALRTWQTALAGFVDTGNRIGMGTAVLGIAASLAARGEAIEAVRLLGAVEANVAEVYASLYRLWARAAREQALPPARAALSEKAFARAWAAGQALSLDEATDLALAVPESAAPATNPGNATIS